MSTAWGIHFLIAQNPLLNLKTDLGRCGWQSLAKAITL